MRASLVPAVVILLLLGLVFLLPKRDADGLSGGPFVLPGSAAAGADVAAALLELPSLDLLEPPDWALQRGAQDELARALDRLSWGSHGGLQASVERLEAAPSGLADEVLARLQVASPHDVILVSKLLAVLSHDLEDDPRVVEELVTRAFSESSLVAKAALRALGQHPSPAALGGILDRRDDPDAQVREAARAALVNRIRMGDPEALLYVLEDLEKRPDQPDARYLNVLAEVPTDERVLQVLRDVQVLAPYEAQVLARAALVAHGDPEAVAAVEALLEEDDLVGRLNALQLSAQMGAVVGRDSWRRLVDRNVRQEVLFLMSVMKRAVETGDEAAPLAMELFERIAQDPTHNCQSDGVDILFALGHPWGVERTRNELRTALGPYLGRAVDRIERLSGELAPQFGEIAFERLADPATGPVEQVLLCRLLAHIDAVRGADYIVGVCMDPERVGPHTGEYLSQLVRLGPAALARLEQELDSDRGAALYIYAAAQIGGAGTVARLEAIALDETKDEALRAQAMDALVRVKTGPREDALRRVALALNDPEASHRAKLLFWNYL